jgi:hypothetical protein
MRTLRTKIWLLPIVTLGLASLRTGVWAQDSGALPPPNLNQAQVAQPSDGGVNWKGVGAGAGAVVSNLVYVPAKLVYGILGGIAGGAGYALTGGNKQVADSIWRSSLGGDYVLTPDMMTGKQPIYFSGPSQTEPQPPAASGNTVSDSNGARAAAGPSRPMPASGSDTLPATHPIDSGAGLVGATGGPTSAPYAGVNNPGNGYGASSSPPPKRSSSLSDTSVE